MNKLKKISMFAGASAAAITIASFAATPAFSQETEISDQIVILGSRGLPRSAVESPVAVDSVSAEELLATGATETGRILQEIVPSFNFSSSSISDGTDSLRPATLRGLGPDQTLVLINGKRRHKSSLIHVNTSVGRGTAGTDINAIPPSAIKSVEVLRDGASALYGSDAIAGVINFQLKNAPDVGNIQVSAGQTYESDGTTFTASANKGFAFGDDGFINLTYEYRNRENTNRAGLQGTCQYLCTGGMADPSTEALEIAFDRQSFRIGDSDSEQHVVFANLGYTLSENAEFYAFGSYGHRENESGGFYRRANQGDRTLLEFYPNGFLPLIRPTVEDKSLAGGIDWVLADNFTVDTSLNYGSNSFNFEIANSNNVSLGLSSPTVFDAGTLELSEWNANIDAVYTMDVEALEAVTVAFGGGFRKENYQLIAGEPASFADGGFTNVDNTFSPPLFAPTAGAVGAQVFRGFSPDNEVDESRDSYSAYIEVSADLTDRINAQAAGRYENYEGFGGVFTWKFAALARLVDGVNVRGSVSTGFRAPSMQQLYFNSTSTQFVDVMGMVVAQERGTFRNDSTLAQGLGIPELKEEESFSWGAGVVLQPADGITLTVDYYSIDIDDRIMISGAQGRDAVPAAAQAVYDAVGATSGQFFINGVDTETTGVDIVGTYDVPGDIIDGLKLTASANITDTDVVRELPAPGLLDGLDLVTAQDVSILEEWQPKTRVNLGARWTNGSWTLNLQGSRYGKYTVCEGGCTGTTADTQTFSAKWLADAQLDYRFDRGVTVSVGANNIFDTTPDLNMIGQSRGGTVRDSSGNIIVESDGVFQFSRRSAPFGFNGGYYYARVSVDF